MPERNGEPANWICISCNSHEVAIEEIFRARKSRHLKGAGYPGIPFIQGENFTPRDVDRVADVNLKINEYLSAPNPPKEVPKELSWVAVINRTMARFIWPDQDPIGKVFIMGGLLPVRVIGIVGDVKERGIREQVAPEAYFPLTGALDNEWGWRMVVKTSSAPLTALGAIRNHVNALDNSLAVLKPRTMKEVISDVMQDMNLQTLLLGVFAALALLLAADRSGYPLSRPRRA